MKYLKHITAADAGSEDTQLKDAMDMLKDDFDYILAGLEKLDRTDAAASNDALVIAESLGDSLQDVIAQISDRIGQE